MYQNTDKEAIRELAKESFGAHRLRNGAAVVAVLLTTMLITCIFTAGFSFFKTFQFVNDAVPGPGSDGSIIGTEEQYEKIKELDQVEWASFVRKCSTAPLHNDELSGIDARLFAPDQDFYGKNYVTLLDGTFPESSAEVLISDTLADRLGLPHKAGQNIDLNVVLSRGGADVEERIPMTICGVYQNPLEAISSIYEELYLSPQFISAYNPELGQNQNHIYVKLNNLDSWKFKADAMEKLSEIDEAVGGYGAQGKLVSLSAIFLVTVLPVALFLLLVMLCGYFLIYNVFYISIFQDIRFYGMLKTIGSTSGQIRSVVQRQIRLLAAAGIAGGLILGYLMGILAAPKLVAWLTDYALYYQSSGSLWILVLAAAFSWLTVQISARKPLKIASKISPIEAAKYAGKKKSSKVTVLSFALSGVIFLIVCNLTLGYQVEHMVERYNQSDIRLIQKGAIWSLDEPYSPIRPELCEAIQELPFVEQVDLIYQARNQPDFIDGSIGRLYLPSSGRVKNDGKLKEELDAGMETAEFLSNPSILSFHDSGDVRIGVVGVPSDRLEREMQHMKILSGTIDEVLFQTGEYVIYQSPIADLIARGLIDPEKTIQAGDLLELSVYDDELNRYVKKDLKVMTVIKNSDPYGTGDLNYSNLILPDTLYKELYSGYDHHIGFVQIDTEQGALEGNPSAEQAGMDTAKEQTQVIEKLLQGEHNFQVMLKSRDLTRADYTENKETLAMIGFFLAGILGLIGICNVVNTLVTSAFSRKLEFAAMQSIGMTASQMRRMLTVEGLKLCGWSLLVMLPLGGFLAERIAENSTFTGFNWQVFLLSALLVLIVTGLMAVLIAGSLTAVLNRKSLVERLREVE